MAAVDVGVRSRVMRRLALVVVAFALAGCSSSSKSPGPSPNAPGCTPPSARVDWSSSVARLSSALRDGGYTVQKGVLRFFRVDDCKALDNCFGNNPSSPYGFYCLPPAPGGSEVPSLVDAICPAGLKPTWQLREDEAVVFLGRTAPTVRYLGFRSYVFSRRIASGARKDLFASLGDSINQLNIASSGTACGGKGSAFDADTTVITTADRKLDALLRTKLDQAGIPASIVNSDVIPRSVVKMGLDVDGDAFAMLYRVALFGDAAAGEAYLQGGDVTVLRITPKAATTIDPAPVPELKARGTGTTEADYQAALGSLIDALAAKYAPAKIETTRMISIAPVGLECLKTDVNCLGDNQDTLYIASAPNTIDAEKCFYVVAGVNHQVSGKATYMNVSVYATKKIMGVGSVTDAQLSGSADALIADSPQKKALYAYAFKRDCGGEAHCFTIPSGAIGVPIGERMNFIMRPYLEAATRVAPDSGEIEMPYVLRVCP